MSYLDNNPFNRPTPNFTTNINSFNTYTSPSSYNNYLSPSNTYSYQKNNNFISQNKDNSYGGYFAKNSRPAEQYKYSRTVQDSPFITGSNPFAMSNAYHQRQSYTSGSVTQGNGFYQPNRPSYDSSKNSYTYQARISTQSGFTDPYQQSYFKNDKYEQKFRKSTFQQDFQLQMGRSRQQQADVKYKTAKKEVEISKLLQNNPFRQKTSLQTGSTMYLSGNNKYSDGYDKKYQGSIIADGKDQYAGYGKYNNYTNENQIEKYSKNSNNHDNNFHQFPPFSDEKKKNSLQHKPTSLSSSIATSNVNMIPGFRQYNYDYNYNNKLAQQQQAYDLCSQKGSKNTFINRINDVISSEDDDNNLREEKKIMENPFSRQSNPFATRKKNESSSIKSFQIGSSSSSGSRSKQPQGLRLSKGSSIQYDDFLDIDGKQGNNEAKNENNYDKYIFKRTSYTENPFQPNNQQHLQGSQKKSITDNVIKQSFSWANTKKQSSNKGSNVFDRQSQFVKYQADSNILQRKSQLELQKKTSNVNLVESLTFNNLTLNNNKIEVKGSRAKIEEIKESTSSNKISPFMKQSEQSIKERYTSVGVMIENHQILQSNKQPLIPAKTQLKPNPFNQYESKKSTKSSKTFVFPQQNFSDDEQIDQDFYQQQRSRQREPSLKRISEVNLSAQRESNPNFSTKHQSQASQVNKNTEQEIDQKLQKLRYTYQKQQKKEDFIDSKQKQVEITRKQQVISIKKQQQNINLQDFIDINADQFNESYHYNQQSSFQVVPTQDYNEQGDSILRQKRTNLKDRVINRLKDDSLSTQIKQINTQSNQFYQENKFVQITKAQNNSSLDNLGKDQKQKYEFQPLQEFENKYQMKDSGFDFDDDEFQETERQFGDEFQEEHFSRNKDRNDQKVLVAEYGYQQQIEKQHERQDMKNEVISPHEQRNSIDSPKRSYISSVSSGSTKIQGIGHKRQQLQQQRQQQLDDDYLPSFSVKQNPIVKNRNSLKQQNLYRNKQNDKDKKIIRYIQCTQSKLKTLSSSVKPIAKEQQRVQIDMKKQQHPPTKVHRVKIYESQSQSQPYRSSVQYDEVHYISPFQKRAEKPSVRQSPYNQKQSSTTKPKLPQQQQPYYVSNSNDSFAHSSVRLFNSKNSDIQHQEKLKQEQQQEMDEFFSQTDLNDRIKHGFKKQMEYSPKFGEKDSSSKSKTIKQPPVRDSFEFGLNAVTASQFAKSKQEKNGKGQQSIIKRKYPQTIELRGDIFHLIQLK